MKNLGKEKAILDEIMESLAAIEESTLREVFEEEYEDVLEISTLMEVYEGDEFPFEEQESGPDDPEAWSPPEKPEPEEPKEEFTYRVHFNRGVLWTDYQKKLLRKFMIFTRKGLGLKEPVEIYLLNKRKDNMTTGAFDIETKKIFVLAKDRHHADVFRSIAHEMVHFFQKERGIVKSGKKIPEVGGKIEDQANAIAGQVVKYFGRKVGKNALYDIMGDEDKYKNF